MKRYGRHALLYSKTWSLPPFDDAVTDPATTATTTTTTTAVECNEPTRRTVRFHDITMDMAHHLELTTSATLWSTAFSHVYRQCCLLPTYVPSY